MTTERIDKDAKPMNSHARKMVERQKQPGPRCLHDLGWYLLGFACGSMATFGAAVVAWLVL